MAAFNQHLSRVCRRTAVLSLPLLSACSQMAYYAQAARGQWDLMHRAVPVEQAVQQEDLPEAVKNKLRITQRIRDFASKTLHLPDNPSYRRFADIRPRTAPVWNVVAADALSLDPKKWCFPIAGCVDYKGYFAQEDAQAFALEISQETPGLETNVYPVPAYSTLGYSNWLGGDPLLSSFINYPEGELARLIFHELAHQVLYVQGDSTFNESFASAVEQMGVQAWMQGPASPGAAEQYAVFDARRKDFRALTLSIRQELQKIYANPLLSNESKHEQKKATLERFHASYQQLKSGPWQGYTGYDRWVSQANNASFANQGTYEDLRAQFEAIFEQQGKNWPAFYAEVKRIAQHTPEQRAALLAQAAAPPKAQ